MRLRFPTATGAMLAGSVLTPARTASSDLDVLVFFADDEAWRGRWRATIRWRGWPAEVFANTDATARTTLVEETAARRSPLLRMLATGVVLRDETGELAVLVEQARDDLARGPAALTAAEVARARYAVTDLLDDLRDAAPEEVPFIAAELVAVAADTFLGLRGRWIGRGKWLLRELAACDPVAAVHAAAALAAVAGPDVGPVVRFADLVLAEAGGALAEGYGVGPVPPGLLGASR